MRALACEGGRPVRSSFLVFGRPQIGEEEIQEVVDTLKSGWIGFGPKCVRFEETFSDYAGAEHALAVNSCTAALHLALIGSGVGPGDEVITTPLTFAATANVITHVGARPVFADVDPATQNLDPQGVADAVTPRTRALMPVHMTGWPCELDALGGIAERHGLTVVEDAAHATEAWHRGRKVGSISRFTAFSFYATKNLTTAEGGMLTSNDAGAMGRLKSLRLHGLDKDAWRRYSPGAFVPYQVTEPGYKYNMTDLQASLGLHQLARLEENLRRRESLWSLYDRSFADLEELSTPPALAEEGTRHARHLYTVQLQLEQLTVDRTEFLHALAAENVGSGVHFIPVHLHRWYRQNFGYRRGDFPHAEAIGDRTVSLPLSPAMTEQDAADVVSAVRKVVAHYRRKATVAAGWDPELVAARRAAS